MTIKRSKETGCMVAQCDVCFDVVDFEDLKGFDKDDWVEAKERIDADGWRTKKVGDKWTNTCVDCVSK
ncbi:hypothetical protein P9A30_gp45 [Sphingomonas phage Lucius]|uniref:Uncharacterized protein n=1 Tax=Sphingomonas phage Lucius TaxID=2686313 RepID=A0A6M3T853_9CAUD|nr:hypothetical protein P9A30_gp45 [Sphingomonas phage Lucius]QJD54487.1 hypothetical protein [Sphingomonas phage Lucius]